MTTLAAVPAAGGASSATLASLAKPAPPGGRFAPAGRELVLEGERSQKEAWEPCEKTPPGLRWRMPNGELLPVRCGRSNSCPKCAWLAAVENVAVVALDAKIEQPTVGMTLTTRQADFDLVRYRRAVERVFAWLRAEFGKEVGYLLMMEWTTGSGGHGRLPHGHLLVKRLPAELDLSEGCDLWHQLKAEWEKHTGAWRVELRELRTPGGAIAYMVGHHHKREQAPPEGFTGKRTRPSKNYYARPIAELRVEARAHRARAIALMRVAQIYGDAVLELAADSIDELVDAHLSGSQAELVRVQDIPTSFSEDGLPESWDLQVVGLASER